MKNTNLTECSAAMRESRIHLNQRSGNKPVISRLLTLILAGLILPIGSLTFSGCGKKEQADKGMKEAVAEEMAKPIQHRRMMPDDMTLDEIIKQLKKYTPMEDVSVRENSTFYRYSVGLLEHYKLLCDGLETIEDYTYLKAIEWIARNRGPAALPRERYIKSLIHLGAEFSTRSPWETKTIKLLLKDFKKRPDLYPKDFINLFLFDIAKASCEEDGGEIILKAGANINAKDADGMTALMHAANFARDKVTKLLLKHGADVKIRDSSGKTALMYAADHEEDDVARLLLEHGAEVNAKNESGETALMVAATNGYEKTVTLLLEHGADADLRNADGKTARELAARYSSSAKERAARESITNLLMRHEKED
ncbi:MAG: ankyrin repeat domain-containing protein [Akkermansia sp.]